jgi:hypothetical protein
MGTRNPGNPALMGLSVLLGVDVVVEGTCLQPVGAARGRYRDRQRQDRSGRLDGMAEE